jgi:hypothetical protein
MNPNNGGLELTAEEASRLLTLCLVSPGRLDREAESALKKLAVYCRDNDRNHFEGQQGSVTAQ